MGFQVTACRVGIGKEPSCPHKVLSALVVRMLLHPLLGCLKDLLSVALDCSSPSHDFLATLEKLEGGRTFSGQPSLWSSCAPPHPHP